jgi:NAD(P)-dependent dehydrogenase (short-subunit alcohol dehydrogenase family)
MSAVAVVTGAASGIGAATSHELGERGHHVVVLDVRADEAGLIVDQLRHEGISAEVAACDVSNRDDTFAAMKSIIDSHGHVDVLVNNAVNFLARGVDATTDDWDAVLGVNVRGYSNMVQAALPGLRRSPHGAIVNVASISAHVAQPARWTYNATKGAIVSLTRCMALDLAPDGIRVNCVSPGWIWTPEVEKAASGDRERWEPVWGQFHMLRRLGEPREVATAIAFLCSEDASFVTAAEFMVDGGYLGMGPEGLGDQSAFAGSRSMGTQPPTF